MSGLQRDHTVNGDWTNHEGYNDGTAGAALNNIMRQQARRTVTIVQTKPPVRQDGGTTYIQVPHTSKAEKPKPKAAPQPPPRQKTPDELALKTARTVYTVIQMVARLQGLSMEAITLRDKPNAREWTKVELEAPPPK